MPDIQERHKKLAFYGVPSSGTAGYVLTRMKYFTQLTLNKNPIEHNVKYVDEATQRNHVAGYDTSISYGFDKYTDDSVLSDIINITDKELTGAAASRFIMIVDTATNKATLRKYSVIPGSEGDDANVYTFSGTFKAAGELTVGTAVISDANAGQTATFTPDET